jgi:HEAT repeat protein
MVGIGRLGDESDPHLLMNALQTDPSPAVRVAAATALGKLKCWEAGPLLIDALEDPDSRVRSRAGAAIDRIVGVKLGFDATDPKRNLVIQKIKTWWPEFYAGYLKRKAGG